MSINTTKLRENVAKEHIGLWVDPTGIILALCDELDQARELLEGTAEQHDETLKTCSHLTEKIADLEGKWQAAMNALVTVEEQRDQARAALGGTTEANGLLVDELKQTRAVVLKLRDVVEATSNIEPSKLSAWRDTESYEQYR